MKCSFGLLKLRTGSRLSKSLSITGPLAAALLLLSSLWAAPVLAVQDALEQPSLMLPKAQGSVFLDVANAGQRLVAVGERGHIFYSDDAGSHWRQSQVPVSVTLTAVYFVSPQLGWAVGHDGVVLHTRDGGQSWVKQLDGYRINKLVLERAEQWLADVQNLVDNADEAQLEELELELENKTFFFEDAEAFAEEGASRPLLDLHFFNELEGFVIGAYNIIMYTADGGTSWQPWQNKIPNDEGFHYNAITGSGSSLYIAGESGTFYRSTDKGQTWELVAFPYDGSLFGVLADENNVITFGLKGNTFRSLDQGLTWEQLDTGVKVSLNGGVILPEGKIVLVGNSGAVLFSINSGVDWTSLSGQRRSVFSAVAETTEQTLIVSGFTGLQSIDTQWRSQEQ